MSSADNNIVGEVGLKVVPIDPGFNAGVQKIINKLEGQAKIKIGADTKEAEAAADNLVKKSGLVADGWATAGLQVAGFTAAVYAAHHAVDAVINKFAGLFDQLTQAKAGFSSILKSDAAGGRLLDQIREFARVSPFVTQELVNYSQQLLGVGVASEQIVPLLHRVGDVISSVGGDTQSIGRVLFALTQIKTVGRLIGQDARQLQSALIPITKYLADYMHKTNAEVKKMQEAGTISAETVFAAISAAGVKVDGAMSKATRTIVGAKAVLTDTVKIFLTQQPVLEHIYQDMVKGILALANALGEEKIQVAFKRFFDAVGKVYDALKPFMAQLVNLGSKGGMSTLTILTSTLSAMATILNAFPDSALRAIAVVLSSMAVMRAPLAMISMISRLQQFSSGLFGAATAEAKLTAQSNQLTLALDRQAEATTRLGRLSQSKLGGKIASYAPLAMTVAGSYVSDGNGGERDAVGGILQGAGMGAMIGSALGPAGTAAGAVVGATVSAVTTIIGASAKAKEAAEKAGKELAATYVKSVTDHLTMEFGSEATPDKGLTEFFGEIGHGQTVIDNTTKYLDGLEAAMQKGNENAGQARYKYAQYNGEIAKTKEVLVRLHQEQDALLADPKYVAYLQVIIDKMKLVNGNNPGTLTKFFPTNGSPDMPGPKITAAQMKLISGEALPKSAAEVDFLREQWARLGLTFDYVSTHQGPEIQDMIDRFSTLPDSFKDASVRASDFGAKMKAAALEAADSMAVFKDEIAGVGRELAEVQSTNQAFGGLYKQDKRTGKTEVRKDVSNIEVNALGSQIEASATTEYARVIEALKGKKGVTDADAALQATAARTRVTYGEFKILQDTLGLTDDKFKELLNTTGLWNLYSGSFDAKVNTNVESLGEMSKRLGFTTEELAKYMQLGKTNDTTRIISTKETDDLFSKLKLVNDQIAHFAGHGDLNSMLTQQRDIEADIAVKTREVTAAITEQETAYTKLFTSFSGQIDQYLSNFDRAKSFSDTLTNVYELTKDNQISPTKDIHKLSGAANSILSGAKGTYDSTFASSAKGGATDAEAGIKANAAAADYAVGKFAALKAALGDTDAQFQSLLVSLGLVDQYNLAVGASNGVIVGSLDSVATQLGVSNDKLWTMAGLIGDINKDITIVVSVDSAAAESRIKWIRGQLDNNDHMSAGQRTAYENELPGLTDRVASGITAVDPNMDPLAKAQKDEADRQAKAAKTEADRLAKEAETKLKQWQQSVMSATDSLTNSLTAAADNIVAAAEKWVTSIKERTQYEQAVSAGRLIKNANSQAKDLTEVTSGLANLRGRGVSQAVLDALGISSIKDTRQIRKLVNSSDGDLSKLTEAVTNRDKLAQTLAVSEEDRRTRDNITKAILDAAKTLNIDISKDGAKGISNQFNITPGLNADDIAAQILSILSGGKIGR